jgi:hypothetical protein
MCDEVGFNVIGKDDQVEEMGLVLFSLSMRDPASSSYSKYE